MTTNRNFTYEEIFTNKKTALFVVAHPDDIDGFFPGLIIKLISSGITCYFQILTSGEAAGKIEDREKEQLNSLKIAGVPSENIEFNRLPDSNLKNDLETIALVSKVIRERHPDIVCTIDPNNFFIDSKFPHINHRDHRIAGEVTLDAVYPYSSLETFFPEYGKPFKTMDILLAESNTPNFVLDISENIEIKKKMLKEQGSQWDEKVINEIIEECQLPDGKFVEQFFYSKLKW